jgi:hypothetical protein
MADFLIERSLFRRILDRYFEAEIENRAYGSMMALAAKTKPGPALEYARLYREAIALQKTQFEETRQTLADKLAAEDDAGIQRALAALFPRR